MEKTKHTKRGWIFIPLIIAIAVLAALGLAACSSTQGITEQDVIDKGFSIKVTFDYNGGNIVGDEKTSAIVRVKPNSYVPDPSKDDNKLVVPSRTGYSFCEYRIVETDENGEPERDENGDLILGEAFDFTKRVDKDVYIGVYWWTNFTLNLRYGEMDTDEAHAETKTVNIARERDGSPTEVAQSAVRVLGRTFLRYYLDKDNADETEITFPAMLPFSEEKNTIDVYSDSLDGVYQVVNTLDQFLSFPFVSQTNVYLTCDIDMSQTTKSFSFPAQYSGKFYGNGHTISNLDIKLARSQGRSDTNFGLFKRIDEGAVIKDVNFKNVKLTLDLTNKLVTEYNVGILAGTLRGDATVKNVEIDGEVIYTLAEDFNKESLHMSNFVGNALTGSVIENCVYDKVKFTEQGNNG